MTEMRLSSTTEKILFTPIRQEREQTSNMIGHSDDVGKHGRQNKHGSQIWETTMPLDLYTDWFNVLKNDDVIGYDNVMSAMNNQKEKLVNGYFSYNECVKLTGKEKNRNYCADFHRPLILAAAFGSRGVFMKLIKDGADITQTDDNNVNCIYGMIIATSEYREKEAHILEMFLTIRENIDLDDLKALLYAEADDGMLPVELAVKLGAFGIFRAILETSGVYETPSGIVGLTSYVSYNVDVYENHQSWRREIRSPLRLLRYMELDHMSSFLQYGIIKMPLVKAWSKRKKLQSLPMILVWFLCKVVFLVFNILMDPRSFKLLKRGGCALTPNGTSHTTHWACAEKFVKHGDPNTMLKTLVYFTGLAMLFSVIFLLHDLIELIIRLSDKESRTLYRIPRQSQYVAYTRFYRICQAVLCFNGTVGGIWMYLVADPEKSMGLLSMKAINLPFILMGVLYILEPLPIFGYFAITLQRMITAMLKFCALQILIETTFTVFFMSAETHMVNFSSISVGFYSMFLLSQNILNFGFTPAWYVRISHYLHHFIGNILLMNYLIAVMSSLICTDENERKAIQLIRNLDVCFLVEDRYTRWFWKLVGKFKRIRPVEINVAK